MLEFCQSAQSVKISTLPYGSRWDRGCAQPLAQHPASVTEHVPEVAGGKMRRMGLSLLTYLPGRILCVRVSVSWLQKHNMSYCLNPAVCWFLSPQSGMGFFHLLHGGLRYYLELLH